MLFSGPTQQRRNAPLVHFTLYPQQQSDSLTRRYRLQFSSGVVEFDAAHPQSLEQLLHDSDEQMYLSKKQKRVAI